MRKLPSGSAFVADSCQDQRADCSVCSSGFAAWRSCPVLTAPHSCTTLICGTRLAQPVLISIVAMVVLLLKMNSSMASLLAPDNYVQQ